jgi:phospholipid/cholesterol/gamma-HCH transport system substrate-binding protein
MKRSIFGVHQFDEIVGAVVLACLAVFIGVLINAGLLKNWFQPSFTLRILLPDEGVSGLAAGAEVQVLGTRAGEIRQIVIDPNQRMHAVARIDDQMRPFIRRDSVVSIRRQFGVAGAAFIDISRGTGSELDWSYAVIAATSERAPTDTLGQMIDELRAKIIPLLDDVQKAVVAFTVVAHRAVDPAGPLEQALGSARQTLASAAEIARRVENGEGLAGRLIANDKLANDLEASLLSVRELAAQLARTSKDPRIGQILLKTDSILGSLQTTTRNLAAATPRITQNVAVTTEALPTTLLQAQVTAHQLELLLNQLRNLWLLGGSGSDPAAAPSSRRAPAVEVRP